MKCFCDGVFKYFRVILGTIIDLYPTAVWTPSAEKKLPIGSISIANLTLRASSMINVLAGNSRSEFVRLSLDNLEVDYGASITANGFGYAGWHNIYASRTVN